MTSLRLTLLLAIAAIAAPAEALDVQVRGVDGLPIRSAMVTVNPADAPPAANWYGASGTTSGLLTPDITGFTDADGHVHLALSSSGALQVRVRHPGYRDANLPVQEPRSVVRVELRRETDPERLAASRPANAWFSQVDLGGTTLKKHFALQCAFCHQQGNVFTGRLRSEQEWSDTIARMITYGSRLATPAQHDLPARLAAAYADLHQHPEQVPAGTPWSADLSEVTITQWPIGDALSQMHDLLTHSNGRVYVGDNLKDDMYEIDPATGAYTIYKLPHDDGDALGGLLGARLKNFPEHSTFVGVHSFAESTKDGHIFMTCSVQRRLIEFDPDTKAFTVHRFEQGFYPHTLRIDARDRVWFTLALSNQVGVLDRRTGKVSYIDLPTRSFKEWLTIKLVGPILKLASWGVPLNKLPIDFQSSGLPLPYGIDIAPDGGVWFARLYADDIGRVDPDTLEVKMYSTKPATGPRRLRSDADGNIWIAAFPESAILKFDPKAEQFTRYDIPVVPFGTETPYSLNVDRDRGIVWVDGNQSDSGWAFDMATESWRFIPLPRQVSFTRDFEITPDGAAWTTNSSFPSWQIEGGQPTLIRIEVPSLQ